MLTLLMLPLMFSSLLPDGSAVEPVKNLLRQERYMETCLEQIMDGGERKGLLEAMTCAHADACSQVFGGAETLQTASCIGRVMNLLTQMVELEAAAQDMAEEEGLDIRQYWRESGVSPQRVAQCAKAAKNLFKAEQDDGVWKQMIAGEAYQRCCSLGCLLDLNKEPQGEGQPSAPQ